MPRPFLELSGKDYFGLMSEERIQTLHPSGKSGTNILVGKYAQIRGFLLKEIREAGEITFEELTDRAVERLSPTFDGKVIWYVVTVKLDLEARGLIERIPKLSPQVLRMKK